MTGRFAQDFGKTASFQPTFSLWTAPLDDLPAVSKVRYCLHHHSERNLCLSDPFKAKEE
jgi:hypothetical protein